MKTITQNEKLAAYSLVSSSLTTIRGGEETEARKSQMQRWQINSEGG